MYTLNQFPLPYDTNALAPYMSGRTLEYHHVKHLATYIANLNDLIAGTKYADMPLLNIIEAAAQDADATKIFNNAAQVFNHNFFFHCMGPAHHTPVPPKIADEFGGIDAFKSKFKAAATSVFGSGWTWLVRDTHGNLVIKTTANADTPIAHGENPILTLDVWEHAYYLDYQNRRAEYADAFFEIVNWDFVAENLTL